MGACTVHPDFEVPPAMNSYLCFTFAFTICMLLWLVFLTVKLFYGAKSISKLIFEPFKWSAAFLVFVMVSYGVMRAYSRWVIFQLGYCAQKYLEYSWQGKLGYAYYIGLNFLLFGFLCQLLSEHVILLQYILFQSCYKQEVLNVIRLKYRMLERKTMSILKGVQVGFGLLMLTDWFIGLFRFYVAQEMLFWINTFFWSALLTVSFAVGIHLQYAMYKHHNYEY